MTHEERKNIVNGREEVEEGFVLRKSKWLIFPINWWEKVSNKSMGNDIYIMTERPIRNLYFNGKKLNI